MSKHKKTEQEEIFDGSQTSRPPSLSTNAGKRLHDEHGQEGPALKRATTSGASPDQLMASFFAAMKTNIEGKAKKIVFNDTKVEQLKQMSLAAKKLPLGILTSADKIAGAIPGEVGKYLEQHGKKLNVQYWKDYVEESFDQIISNRLERPVNFIVWRNHSRIQTT